MNLRGMSHPNTVLPYYYNASLTQDLKAVLNTPCGLPRFVFACSFSGNTLLHLLSKQELPLRACLLVSTPMSLADSVKRLQRWNNVLFHLFFLKALYRDFRLKEKRYPKKFGRFLKASYYRSLTAFDDNVTAPMNGFAGAADYYARHEIKDKLQSIRNNVHFIHAADDPLCSVDQLKTSLACASPTVDAEIPLKGGHAGFYDGRKSSDYSGYWLEKRTVEYFEQYL